MQDLFGENLFRNEQIAMLLYPGFTALDLVGPQCFFACLFGAKVHLVTTQPDLAPVAADLGLAISPRVTLEDTRADLDVLFFPGGTTGTMDVMRSERTMARVKDRAARAWHITSVCTGSMILGKAGLLKGKRATSHRATSPVLEDFGAIPVNERVVKDSTILTGADVSAGLDFAIVLTAQLRGRDCAEALVLQAEFAPEPPIVSGSSTTASARIHDAIERGTMPPRDPDVRDRLKERRAEIDGLNATALTLQQQLQRGPTSITPAAVAKFGKIVRQRPIDGDSKARLRAVQAFVKTVRVGSTIKIEGETRALT